MHVTFDLSNSELETKYSNMLPTLMYLSIIVNFCFANNDTVGLKYVSYGKKLSFNTTIMLESC